MQIELKILNKEFYQYTPAYKGGGMSCPSTKYLPEYATPGSAAIDLVNPSDDIILYPGEIKAIHTGLAIHIGTCKDEWLGNDHGDWGVGALIIPRSGRGAKEGLVIANTLGLIDEDYQGELIVYVMNRNLEYETFAHKTITGKLCEPLWFDNRDAKIEIKQGERFAQIVFIPIIKASFTVVDEFSSSTDRGIGGHGSTGV